jgi:NADPH-dependent glutamate synthase beta subunit-like oxidoreductase/Pyruvate/2-oxoacid:ferredoxin oxidoreductase delta subunit
VANEQEADQVGYRFTFDDTGCLNCGVCMDVCPVAALDMTRPDQPPVEAGAARLQGATGTPQPWMMTFPIQVGECIGCEACAVECPTGVITIRAEAGAPVSLAPSQGPLAAEPPDAGWVPLSAVTRAARKERRTDPWGPAWTWQPARREAPWATWRSWSQEPDRGRLVAPCQAACPIGTNAGLYVGLIAEGRDAEALAVAAEYNPFPSICGRICTAPCEVACRRGVVDEPIAIRELKRFAAEHGEAGYPTPLPPERRRPERVAIVGAGPTGLSAAYQLVRAGYGVTVFEAMPVAGGMMAVGIPEYRLPKRVLQAEVERILSLGVELRLNTAMGRDFGLDDLDRQGFAAILLATGAHKAQRLGIPGEDLGGVWPATLFLKQFNLGEGVRLQGEVVVVGGGSTAMDAARSAWRAGAERVRVLYRRTRADMPAQAEEVRAAEHEGVIIEPLVAPLEILGKNGWITGIRCHRLRVVGVGSDGRSAVEPIPGSEFVLPADGLLVAVGEAPDPSILPEGSDVRVAEWGGFIVDPETLATTRRGVFAAGDVATGPRSVIEGIAQGQRAAWAIDRFLRGLPAARYVPPYRLRQPMAETGGVAIDLANRHRAEVPLAPVLRPVAGSAGPGPAGSDDDGQLLQEVALGFDEATARAEAARCLRCDVVAACPVVEVKRRWTA